MVAVGSIEFTDGRHVTRGQHHLDAALGHRIDLFCQAHIITLAPPGLGVACKIGGLTGWAVRWVNDDERARMAVTLQDRCEVITAQPGVRQALSSAL